jgi:hypothetical protein
MWQYKQTQKLTRKEFRPEASMCVDHSVPTRLCKRHVRKGLVAVLHCGAVRRDPRGRVGIVAQLHKKIVASGKIS